MTYINKQWLLDQRPKGMPGDECWKLNEEEVRPLEKGEVLIKILYLSIDPYMRGRTVSYTHLTLPTTPYV